MVVDEGLYVRPAVSDDTNDCELVRSVGYLFRPMQVLYAEMHPPSPYPLDESKIFERFRPSFEKAALGVPAVT